MTERDVEMPAEPLEEYLKKAQEAHKTEAAERKRQQDIMQVGRPSPHLKGF